MKSERVKLLKNTYPNESRRNVEVEKGVDNNEDALNGDDHLVENRWKIFLKKVGKTMSGERKMSEESEEENGWVERIWNWMSLPSEGIDLLRFFFSK